MRLLSVICTLKMRHHSTMHSHAHTARSIPAYTQIARTRTTRSKKKIKYLQTLRSTFFFFHFYFAHVGNRYVRYSFPENSQYALKY